MSKWTVLWENKKTCYFTNGRVFVTVVLCTCNITVVTMKKSKWWKINRLKNKWACLLVHVIIPFQVASSPYSSTLWFIHSEQCNTSKPSISVWFQIASRHITIKTFSQSGLTFLHADKQDVVNNGKTRQQQLFTTPVMLRIIVFSAQRLSSSRTLQCLHSS